MTTTEIDQLINEFYITISFKNKHIPKLEDLKPHFAGEGILINNSFAEPIVFTAESFLQALESQAAEGNILQFMQRQVNGKTEVFGKIAQHVSVYEYNFAATEAQRLPRGVNYVQLIHTGNSWKIVSMVWSDENENRLIPEEYL